LAAGKLGGFVGTVNLVYGRFQNVKGGW
jgi:hypothetical protein